MRLPKIRELIEALKVLFVEKRFTSKFPLKIDPYIPGMRGFPEIQDSCIGCGACAESCPAKAIDVIDEGNKRTLKYNYGKCILCNTCHANCIVDDGVELKEKYDVAATEKTNMYDSKDFDLIKCEVCGEPISSADHLLWISKKVGTSTYNNPTLFKLMHVSSKTSNEIDISRTNPELRANIGKYLCSKHRRENYIRELWS